MNFEFSRQFFCIDFLNIFWIFTAKIIFFVSQIFQNRKRLIFWKFFKNLNFEFSRQFFCIEIFLKYFLNFHGKNNIFFLYLKFFKYFYLNFRAKFFEKKNIGKYLNFPAKNNLFLHRKIFNYLNFFLIYIIDFWRENSNWKKKITVALFARNFETIFSQF